MPGWGCELESWGEMAPGWRWRLELGDWRWETYLARRWHSALELLLCMRLLASVLLGIIYLWFFRYLVYR